MIARIDWAALDAYRARWRGLGPRGQSHAAAGAAVALLLLAAAAWWPLHRRVAALRRATNDQAVRLAAMRRQSEEVARLRAAGVGDAGAEGASLSAVEESIEQHDLKPYLVAMTREGDSGVQVSFEGVPFNAVVNWLNDVQSKRGAWTDQVFFDAQAGSGLVTGRVVLR